MSANHSGNSQPSIDREEHRSVNGVNAKAVVPYVFDGTNLTPQGNTAPTNVLRDTFNSQDATKWDFTTTKAASDFIYIGGNVAAASWVSICKSALVRDTYTEIISLNTWPLSILASAGLTLSQRVVGQQFGFDIVGVDNTTGAVVTDAAISDVAITLTGITVAANVATVTSDAAHGLLPGDNIAIFGCSDPRVNVGPVVIGSVPTPTTFTCPLTIANATYTTGAAAMVRYVPYDGRATYMSGIHFAGSTSSNADSVSKNGDRAPEISNWNPGNSGTDAAIPNENGLNYATLSYVYPQRNKEEFIQRLHPKHAQYIARDADGAGLPRSTQHRTQNIPDASRQYKVRFRARTLPNYVIPLGSITVASKTASTTATLTIPNHGLTTSDWIFIGGTRDQVNFANSLGVAIQVASVVDTNNITAVFGISASASSYGGTVFRADGSGVPAFTTSAIQTYARVTDARGDRLSVVFAATQGATIIPGEVWTLHGLVDSTNTTQSALHGRYRVELSNTATFTVELTPLDGQVISGVSLTPANAGGLLIRNTELRLHFARVESETNQTVEILGAQGDQDYANALPVSLTSLPTLAALTTVTTVTTVSTVTNQSQMSGFVIKDTLLNTEDTNLWANSIRQRIT